MKIIATAIAVIIVVYCSGPAQAQGIPQGSYQQTCANVQIRGDTLRATCRGRDNREQRSSLAGFQRCVGDIGNNGGVLQCNFADGSQRPGTTNASPPRQREMNERRSGQQYNEPMYEQPPQGGPYRQPRYDGPPAQSPNPNYGAPPSQYPSYGTPPYGPPGHGGYR